MLGEALCSEVGNERRRNFRLKWIMRNGDGPLYFRSRYEKRQELIGWTWSEANGHEASLVMVV